MLCTLQQEGVPAPSVPWSSAEAFSLAVESQVNERKPHQGVTGKNPGLHQRFAACNSTTALGVSWRQWSGTVPGARVTYEYDAFGNQITHTGTTPNNYLYRGEQWDPDLNLYYLRARYYNPLSGRFMSRDPNNPQLIGPDKIPIDPRMLHKYLYAEGDPVNGVDPTGRADYIESVFTLTYVSSPVEIYAAVIGRSLVTAFCFIAKTIVRSKAPPGLLPLGPIPGWPGPAAIVCTAFGY